ncbi:MAG TPA: diacylglycerol kinase family protein [Polyangia bacterium]|nr:diacylglycerol kinase family protein [Polyangia bacterium]
MTRALASRRRIRVVVNPSARSGRGPRLLRDLAATPSPAPLEWVVSRSAAHLRDLVAEAEAAGPGEYEAVAVAGGDGSVRNALAALASPSRIPFGVIPIGSGNDFAVDLGIPRNPTAALALLTDGVATKVDVGRVGAAGPRYCCVASVGLDEVALDVVHNSGFPRCKALNVVAALWALFTYRPRPLRITWQGGTFEDEVMFAAVTNTRGYGGGFMISPGASVTDGALDLCIVARSGRLDLLSKFAHILRGTHAGLPRVTLAQSPWVTIEDLTGGTRAALDGELPDSATPLRLECETGGLEMILPRRTAQLEALPTSRVAQLPAPTTGEEAA